MNLIRSLVLAIVLLCAIGEPAFANPTPLTTTLTAPSPGQTFSNMPSGTTYKADASGNVSNVLASDVPAMLKAGCTQPTGGGGGGGGATLPYPGIVYGTGPTGGTVATSNQIQSAIGSGVYDAAGAAAAAQAASDPSGAASAATTPAAIATQIKTQTGCSTAGYVWVPASNACVAQTGGGGGVQPSGTFTTGDLPVVGAGGSTILDSAIAPSQLALQNATADTTAGASLGIGTSALSGETAAGSYNNTAVGYKALSSSLTTSGSNNTALGNQAGVGITSGSQNTIIGSSAGSGNAVQAVCIGAASCTSSMGNSSIGIGTNTRPSTDSVAVGIAALGQNYGGGSNVGIGYYAGNQMQTGSANIEIGPYVGSLTLTSGSNNILLGGSNAVDTPAASTSYYLNIANTIKGTLVGGTTPALGSVVPWSAPSFQSSGTKFAASGCSNSATTGGATAGTYTSGTAGSCSVTVSMGSSATAPNGWACSATDRTTPGDVIGQTASTTTTATLVGTTASGDVIGFSCMGY